MNPIKISGVVIEGNKLGRKLGFPTANIELPASSSIETGIYAAWAQVANDTEWYKAAVHLGPRPTIQDTQHTLEAHLLDFPDKTIYGEYITLYLMEKIREVQNFTTLEELRVAIATDCTLARDILDTLPE